MNEHSNSPSGPAPDRISPDFSAATSPSYTRSLLLGPDGLRPGWGIAFYVLMFLFLQWFAWKLAWSFDFGFGGLWSMLLEECLDFVAAVIPALILARVEHRRWGSYGFPARQAFGRSFWAGALWGFAFVSLLIFSLYALHDFSFGHVILHGARLARFAAYWGVFFLAVGFFEEFFLRGYVQFTLSRGLGFWPAAVALSTAFGLFHLRNRGEHWPGILAAACIGFFFCLTLRRTGSLWFAVGFHAAWDWGETFFYSVPDSGSLYPGHLLKSTLSGPEWLSGGSVGPEGSLLCFIVIALAWIAFDRTHPRVAAPALAAESSSR